MGDLAMSIENYREHNDIRLNIVTCAKLQVSSRDRDIIICL